MAKNNQKMVDAITSMDEKLIDQAVKYVEENVTTGKPWM